MEGIVKLQGFKELAEQLKQLPQRLAANALRAAAAAGAAEVRKEAKKLAPVYTGPVSQGHPPPGTLKRAIYSGYNRRRSQPHAAVAIVSVRQGKREKHDAYYARWVEFGHFTATPKGAGSLRARRKAARESGAARWVAARPFLRPAFEVARDRAIQAVADKISERLKREAERSRAEVAAAR